MFTYAKPPDDEWTDESTLVIARIISFDKTTRWDRAARCTRVVKLTPVRTIIVAACKACSAKKEGSLEKQQHLATNILSCLLRW